MSHIFTIFFTFSNSRGNENDDQRELNATGLGGGGINKIGRGGGKQRPFYSLLEYVLAHDQYKLYVELTCMQHAGSSKDDHRS